MYLKGDRVLDKGITPGKFGTVYQDQNTDQTVKVVWDRERNVMVSVDPSTIKKVDRDEERRLQWLYNSVAPDEDD